MLYTVSTVGPALGQSFVSIGLPCLPCCLHFSTFHAAAAADGELVLVLADPAPPSWTADCPRAQGRPQCHRPNKPSAAAAAHHISGPPPDAIRPRPEQSRHTARTSALKPSLIHFCSLWLTSSCLQQTMDWNSASVVSAHYQQMVEILEPCTPMILSAQF